MIGVNVVSQHVARNPIARAIARKKIADAVQDFQTRLYLLQDGENVASDIQASAQTLGLARRILDQRGESDSREARIMAGGLGALMDMSNAGHLWRKRHLVALDVALECAVEVYRTATAKETQAAYRYLESLA